ncbi:peptide-methionine (R)-S-oxide reductase MsrB [Candidatus Enterovibrio escicola]|uniref:peptide-methionine (R)-S-oxide reductase n=1 Tax=Candidatus Enterovibrio escicola TaxID=1927127 RepID=A0A2A5T7X5_9GAMM|nr:peptide-methionine (R)-S-oxide reductase MsrB [Candidatus Enterovibrio escacola]PCS24254.1 Peptide methionine sulfoxide reductase MsrB [Candidatus Enterovibrio escacola]
MTVNINNKWKNDLSELAFNVCKLGQTEPPFSGILLHNHKSGFYNCICCDQLLFDSNTKFDSGSGWPSFNMTIDGSVRYLEEKNHGIIRIEIRCMKCDSHLGHVFDDSSTETNRRYCVNSVSMTFRDKV